MSNFGITPNHSYFNSNFGDFGTIPVSGSTPANDNSASLDTGSQFWKNNDVGSIFTGASNIIGAFKGNAGTPSSVTYVTNTPPAPESKKSSNTMLWIVIPLVVLVIGYFMFKK